MCYLLNLTSVQLENYLINRAASYSVGNVLEISLNISERVSWDDGFYNHVKMYEEDARSTINVASIIGARLSRARFK